MKAFSLYHPLVLFLYFLSILLAAMFLFHPVLQAEALLGAVLFCLVLRRRRAVLSDLGFYIPMFIMVAILNPLFSHNGVTPLFFLNGNPVTLEAILYGVAMAVMLVGVMLWCKCYSEIMTTDKFLYLFGSIVPKLSLVLSMALRFIPMLRRQMRRVNRAQRTLGLYSAKSFVDRLRSAFRVFSAMVAWSLEHSMEVSASMKARGYGTGRRTHFSVFRFSAHDGVLLSLCAVLFGVTLGCAAVGAVSFRFYPEVGTISCSPASVAAYCAFGILSFLPFIVEVKEALVWNYYVSKI